MAAGLLTGDDWNWVVARLSAGVDLEATALGQGALVRRRGVADATRLLRLALVYGGTALSLRGVAAWAKAAAVADLSDVALMYRLQGAERWLGWLLQEVLSAELGALAAAVGAGGWRLRLIDGTALAPPGGAAGVAWRVHASFDLGGRRFDQLELTTGQASESLERFTAAPGEILIADRFYAKAKGVHHIAAQGGHLIIRRGLTSCRLRTLDGVPLDGKAILARARAGTDQGALVDLPVLVPAADGAAADPVRARLIIQRKPPEAAARARRQAGQKARRQHYRPHAKQLEAADYLILMTSLPGEAMAARQVIALDRLRWQIELAFKRLKSLIGLADLAAKEARLAKAALYAKLILAVLCDSLVGHVLARSPSAPARALAADPARP
jgi:hypothetical protein